MKTTITRNILTTLILLLGLTFASYAQTYYDVYLCDNATATLQPQEPNLTNGDKVHWYLGATEVAVYTYAGGTSANYTVPGNLPVGAHSYTTRIESAAGCLGDPSDPFSVYKLPTKTLALSTPTNTTYCGDNSNPAANSSQITATASPASPLPDGVGYTYTWTATFNGNPVMPITTIGSSNGSTTNQNVFTLTASDAGSYVLNATVNYTLLPGNIGVLRAGAGCEVSATATQTITITPKPGKPSISLAN
ncbi:hypothetical protein [Pedobacter nanyangensis]|uniref:hypothetical protein n=1 Tax=Pedobacter nanyangensis TaxID=1562389 RepID=UPI000DE32FEB|nr:hypothetical protein [Pedobacter nanyangensis]